MCAFRTPGREWHGEVPVPGAGRVVRADGRVARYVPACREEIRNCATHVDLCCENLFLTYLSGVMSDWFVCTYGLIFVEWMDGLSDLFVCID